MTENEINITDLKALEYFGKAYVKIPRILMKQLFSSDKHERMKAQLHWLLYCNCYYTDGYISVNGQQVYCRRGEYIGTYEELAGMLGVDSRTIRRYVDMLISNSFIEVRKVLRRICFRVCGYDYFTDPEYGSDAMRVSGSVAKGGADCDEEELARRRDKVEQQISGGQKPRIDLLKEL